jgi:hypothetical protein
VPPVLGAAHNAGSDYVVEKAVMGVSGGLRLTDQAARSMTASVGLVEATA